MKKLIFLTLWSVLILSGCRDDFSGMVVDYSPIVITVRVVDVNGVDMLSPEASGVMDITKIKATYKGQQFDCKEDEYDYFATRYYMPDFYELKVSQSRYFGTYILQFGEFDGSPGSESESVTITWPDGSSDKISFQKGSKKTEWTLNGSKIPDGNIKLVK